MVLVLQILGGLVGLLVALLVAAWAFGRYLVAKGQAPIDTEALAAEGGKLATNEAGRRIEYFVYGSTDPSAPVVINLHGSGPEAGSERDLHGPVCDALGVRGIAVSLPGYGNTDMKPGRVVAKWPREDLDPVLRAEGVDRFMIIGHSQGTPHAMAAAVHFGERCTGVGLNAPFLPATVSREVGIEGALGMDSLLPTASLRKGYNAWYFAVYHLGVVTFSPWLPMKVIAPAGSPASRDARLLEVFRKTIVRAVVRGSVGGAWESTRDVCYEWGFDPRDTPAKNFCIWHADDDRACPPAAGHWLAEFFAAKPGVHVDYRHEKEGYGHVTYCRGEYVEPDGSMISALLRASAEA